MEMQQIRYFMALARTLNFTRAAEDCNVSQPALTRAIQALEAELGGDLIRRERSNSHLTPLGQRMLPLLQQCYEAARSAQSLAKSVKSNELAPLNLGLSRSINIETFSHPISELFRAYPGVQLKVRRGGEEAIQTMLKAGDVELAVAGSSSNAWERLDEWHLFDEKLSVVTHADHRLARQNMVTTTELRGERFLALADSGFEPRLASYLE
ncbi:MAG TPA: LysR family transcriptional regulator, partial [Stellaceae bacterium]|nr:LysR family transcriptional regulator [Stellaceae bacterium]